MEPTVALRLLWEAQWSFGFESEWIHFLPSNLLVSLLIQNIPSLSFGRWMPSWQPFQEEYLAAFAAMPQVWGHFFWHLDTCHFPMNQRWKGRIKTIIQKGRNGTRFNYFIIQPIKPSSIASRSQTKLCCQQAIYVLCILVLSYEWLRDISGMTPFLIRQTAKAVPQREPPRETGCNYIK